VAKNRQKYNKTKFLTCFILLTGALAGISHLYGLSPLVGKPSVSKVKDVTVDEEQEIIESELKDAVSAQTDSCNSTDASTVRTTDTTTSNFTSAKVWSYPDCFPDSNATQLRAAIENGVTPKSTRRDVMDDVKKSRLTNISSSPFYILEELTHSVPYLVPKAQMLLNAIGINFVDSLHSKGLALHLPVVTSVMRTDEDIRGLQRGNTNSVTNSCHSYGTTIDITYNRFVPVGGGEPTRYDEGLKKVLAEVLFDLRAKGRCYVKYEKQQACFHLTVI